MKPKIHPKLNNVVFLDRSSGARFITTSVLSSKTIEIINGKEYQVIEVETSSASHPFYTKKNTNTQQGGQVAKFRKKLEAAQKAKEKKIKQPE